MDESTLNEPYFSLVSLVDENLVLQWSPLFFKL